MTDQRFDQLPIGSVPLAAIIRDPEHVSPRIGLGHTRLDRGRVSDFRQMLAEDLHALPEPICVETQGSFVLADGHHRLAALEQLANEHPRDRRFEFVSVRVINTSPDQNPIAYAFEIAVEYSAKGPLPLTRADKHAAIARLLTDHPEWSDREIARRVGVDHKTVGTARKRGISPADDSGSSADGVPATSPARLARIAAQIVRYGDQLGSEDSDVDYDELVSELADRFLQLHPGTSDQWVEWWAGLLGDVRHELKARG